METSVLGKRELYMFYQFIHLAFLFLLGTSTHSDGRGKSEERREKKQWPRAVKCWDFFGNLWPQCGWWEVLINSVFWSIIYCIEFPYMHVYCAFQSVSRKLRMNKIFTSSFTYERMIRKNASLNNIFWVILHETKNVLLILGLLHTLFPI